MSDNDRKSRKGTSRRRLKANPPLTEAESALLDRARTKRRYISAKARAFVTRFVEGGLRNPWQAAVDVGLKKPSNADRLVVKLDDLIQAERLRRSMGQQMEVDEAIQLVSGLARGDHNPDVKLQHAALRTVLEVHGVLTGAPRVDRREAMRTIHQIVAVIREKVDKGSGTGSRTTKITSTKLQEQVSEERAETTKDGEIKAK